MLKIHAIFAFAFSALLAGAAGAEAGDSSRNWGDLLGHSPFGGTASGTDLPAPGALEFRGMIQEGAEVWVNLYDPVSKRAEWSVVPGSPSVGLLLESYDPATGHLVIVQAGRRHDLALRQAHVVLPADIRPLVLSVTTEAPTPDLSERESFIRQLPPEAREMLDQAQRRRHPRVPDRATASAEFTNR